MNSFWPPFKNCQYWDILHWEKFKLINFSLLNLSNFYVLWRKGYGCVLESMQSLLYSSKQKKIFVKSMNKNIIQPDQ